MATLRRILSKLMNLVRPGRAERELEREVASHLVLLADEYQRRGMPADQAHTAARRALGDNLNWGMEAATRSAPRVAKAIDAA